jgi:hypothetical protein
MNRLLCILFVAVLASPLSAQDPKPPAKTDTKSVNWKEPVAVDEPARVVAGRRELSVREARRLGITLLSVKAHRKALIESGDIDQGMSSAEKSALVLDRISSGNQKAFDDSAALDLDSIIAFIEKLIELIERFFPS